MLPDDLSIEPYAIAPRGDWAFRLPVNTGLSKTFRDGPTAQQIFEKWFFGAQPGVLFGSVYALGRLADRAPRSAFRDSGAIRRRPPQACASS